MDGQPGHFEPAAAAAGGAYPAGPCDGRAAAAPRPRRPAAAAGFTLIEILIVVVILGILAAIVVPQFSNASHVARENTLKDELRYLRTQIAVYKAQHRDVPPGYPGSRSAPPSAALFASQLTGRTNAKGDVGSDPKLYPLGPYLQKMPPNPLTQATGVMLWPAGTKLPTDPKTIDANQQKVYGWIYRPDTHEIIPYSVDGDGRRPYISY